MFSACEGGYKIRRPLEAAELGCVSVFKGVVLLVFWFIPLYRHTTARKVDSGNWKTEEKPTEVGQEVHTSLGAVLYQNCR
jgi:Ser/Thr protein kinase RdoA (MazF antagonist)